MFKLLKQRAKRYLIGRQTRQYSLNGWAAGPASNETFNKVYSIGAKVTSVAEHVTLFNLSAMAQGNVVEVGCYICLSSMIMMAGFEKGANRRLFAIDFFDRKQGFTNGDLDDRLFRNQGQFEFCQKLAADCGFQNNLILLRGKSADFYDSLEQFGPVGLVFIDGDHSYDGCRQDAAAFHRIVQPGGFLVFHDFLSPKWPGVRQAVGEFLREHQDFTVVCVVDSMLVTRRKI